LELLLRQLESRDGDTAYRAAAELLRYRDRVPASPSRRTGVPPAAALVLERIGAAA